MKFKWKQGFGFQNWMDLFMPSQMKRSKVLVAHAYNPSYLGDCGLILQHST
jgi:hypothetical protein